MSHGGYREKSGRSKSGYYKGIYCGSTYELCWVIYSIEHRIEFTRFPGKLEKDGTVYFPDFLLSDGKTIIETKGYENPEFVDRKTKVAESFGFIVKILRKEDLLYAFDYVEKVYKTKKFYELYDDYKPQYTYMCSFCKNGFHSNSKRKTEKVYCCRSCSMKGTAALNRKENNKKISKTLTGRTVIPYKRKYLQQWITNDVFNTKIRLDEIIPEGFRKGRKTSHDAAGVAASPSNS